MNFVSLGRVARIMRVLLCAGLAFIACASVEAIAPAAAAPDFTLRTMNGPNLRLAGTDIVNFQ